MTIIEILLGFICITFVIIMTIPFWWIVLPLLFVTTVVYLIPLLVRALNCRCNCRCRSFNLKRQTAVMCCPPFNQHSRSLSKAIVKWITSAYACISLEICNSANNISSDTPLIVVCINSTRLKDDISSSINESKVLSRKQFAIIIFHPQAEHAHPPIPSSHVLTDQQFPKYVFDLTYNSFTDSVYQCDFNNKALINITEFIRINGKTIGNETDSLQGFNK